MSIKDLLLQAGVFVTLILGLVNLYFNLRAARRASFINTVTTERIKWIGKVRENVSMLCTLCDPWLQGRGNGDLPRQTELKKNEIRLQLNPNDPEDNDIASLLDKLPSWTRSMTPQDTEKLLRCLVQATQAMLKREWDKVKDEAVHGDLRSRAK